MHKRAFTIAAYAHTVDSPDKRKLSPSFVLEKPFEISNTRYFIFLIGKNYKRKKPFATRIQSQQTDYPVIIKFFVQLKIVREPRTISSHRPITCTRQLLNGHVAPDVAPRNL